MRLLLLGLCASLALALPNPLADQGYGNGVANGVADGVSGHHVTTSEHESLSSHSESSRQSSYFVSTDSDEIIEIVVAQAGDYGLECVPATTLTESAKVIVEETVDDGAAVAAAGGGAAASSAAGGDGIAVDGGAAASSAAGEGGVSSAAASGGAAASSAAAGGDGVSGDGGAAASSAAGEGGVSSSAAAGGAAASSAAAGGDGVSGDGGAAASSAAGGVGASSSAAAGGAAASSAAAGGDGVSGDGGAAASSAAGGVGASSSAASGGAAASSAAAGGDGVSGDGGAAASSAAGEGGVSSSAAAGGAAASSAAAGGDGVSGDGGAAASSAAGGVGASSSAAAGGAAASSAAAGGDRVSGDGGAAASSAAGGASSAASSGAGGAAATSASGGTATSATSGTGATTTTTTTTKTTKKVGQIDLYQGHRRCFDGQGICTPFFLCKDEDTVSDGTFDIDIRLGPTKRDDYKSTSECSADAITVCCLHPQPRPVQWIVDELTQEPHTPECGKRNPEGFYVSLNGFRDSEAQFGEFPWMVFLTKKQTEGGKVKQHYVCGGSLIADNLVLTAGHCVEGIPASSLVVRAGDWDTRHTTEFLPHEEYHVQEVIVHERLNTRTLFNDVAILVLDHHVRLQPHIDTICLPEPGEQIDYNHCVATGFGRESFESGTYEHVMNIMKQVDLRIVDHDACQTALRTTRLGRWFRLHDSFTCAGGEEGVDTCRGDGGSPLVCQSLSRPGHYVQVGIVAWGIGCGERGIPGVYADVQKLLPWIHEHVPTTHEPYQPVPIKVVQEIVNPEPEILIDPVPVAVVPIPVGGGY